MNILFNKNGNKTPLRPKPQMVEVKKLIIRKALESYFKEPNHGFDEAEKRLLPDTLMKHWDYYIDEFFLTDCFKEDGWNIDAGFVTRLESICTYINDSFDDEVLRWAKDNDIVPPFNIGDSLDIGCITGISKDHAASFEVLINGMDKNCKNRKVVKFEDAKPESSILI
ncbi:hypothetical protein [Aliivibrio fischeri]|uniref:hypothetical protein n=1 Tax=Aliivibrio fischeri TaxID=668 RepID=UPI0007C57DC7|nr:hypothetical protein [Aliivibrio fischeri]